MAVGSGRRGGEGVADGGHELVAHGDVERRVGAGDGVEGGGGANDAVVLEVEEVEFVALKKPERLRQLPVSETVVVPMTGVKSLSWKGACCPSSRACACAMAMRRR